MAIKPGGPATGLKVSPVMEGGRVYQLMMLVLYLNKQTESGMWGTVFKTKRWQRLVRLNMKATNHLLWMIGKKLPKFDKTRGWKFRYMDHSIEGTNWIFLYKEKLEPVKWYKDDPEPSKNVLCVKCDWIMARADIEQLGWLKECPQCHPKPVDPEEHHACLDCDADIHIHQRGDSHCVVCDDDTCKFNQ